MGMKQQAQDQQQALKCPRCDSSNTKFCYYNNYSLSQPRHFCKACKRYWTRGGTLRSVPVGGGCRKNKRLKRPNSVSDLTTTNSSTNQIGVTRVPIQSNQMFYGLQPNSQSDINLTFPSFSSSVLNEITSSTGYAAFRNGFSSIDPSIQINDVTNSSANLASFLGYGSSSSTSPTSFSSLQPQDFIISGLKEATKPTNHYQDMFPFKDLLLGGCGTDLMSVTRELKLEEEEAGDLINNKVDFGTPCAEPVGTFESSVHWNSVGAWPDLSNYGPSLTSSI